MAQLMSTAPVLAPPAGHVAGQREDASADAGRDHHHGEAEQIEAVRVDDLTFVAGGSCAGGEAPVEGFRGSVRHSPSFIWGSKGMLTQGTARCERSEMQRRAGQVPQRAVCGDVKTEENELFVTSRIAVKVSGV